MPFVPKTDFYLVNHTIVNSCEGDPDAGPLTPEQRALCLRCGRQASRAACLATVSESFYDGAGGVKSV